MLDHVQNRIRGIFFGKGLDEDERGWPLIAFLLLRLLCSVLENPLFILFSILGLLTSISLGT
jgi:hypothetical protein